MNVRVRVGILLLLVALGTSLSLSIDSSQAATVTVVHVGPTTETEDIERLRSCPGVVVVDWGEPSRENLLAFDACLRRWLAGLRCDAS